MTRLSPFLALMQPRLYSAPWKYKRFLKNFPLQRSASTVRLHKASYLKKRSKIERIHRNICLLPYREDPKGKDVWEIKTGTTPRDCDDKVLEERMLLHDELRIPYSALRPQLCLVPTYEGWKGHMVLILTLSDRDIVLDSNMIIPLPYPAFRYRWFSRAYTNEEWQRPTFYGKVAPR